MLACPLQRGPQQLEITVAVDAAELLLGLGPSLLRTFKSTNPIESGALLEGSRVRGRKREVLAAALHHATAVTTWHSLVVQQGLTDAEAVGLLAGMVLSAAAGRVPSLSVDADQPPAQEVRASAP